MSKCCKCDKPAVAWWPAIDPDTRSWPWCRECLDDEKERQLLKLLFDDKNLKE